MSKQLNAAQKADRCMSNQIANYTNKATSTKSYVSRAEFILG